MRRTLELLLIMSQQELQKTSDLRDASARLVLVSEVQMIHLLWRKSDGLILCRGVQK